MEAVVKGSLAMKNGSFKNLTATEISNLSDDDKTALQDEVAGIVFWTTADSNTSGTTPARLTDDAIMAKDFPNCTHGLIVSLKDVYQGTKWQSTYTNIASWQSSNAFDAENKNDYKSVASGTGTTAPINYILGYQNTKILKAYNATLASGSVKTVLPVSLLESWEETNPAPANTTGWFIPSEKELTLLCGKDVDGIMPNGSVGTDTKTAMNTILTSLGTDYADTFGTNYYWSSSEYAGVNNLAFVVYFNGSVKYYSKVGNSGYVRAVCAF